MVAPGGCGLSLLGERAGVDERSVLSGFRVGLFGCLTARADVLFELTDAMLCAVTCRLSCANAMTRRMARDRRDTCLRRWQGSGQVVVPPLKGLAQLRMLAHVTVSGASSCASVPFTSGSILGPARDQLGAFTELIRVGPRVALR